MTSSPPSSLCVILQSHCRSYLHAGDFPLFFLNGSLLTTGRGHTVQSWNMACKYRTIEHSPHSRSARTIQDTADSELTVVQLVKNLPATPPSSSPLFYGTQIYTKKHCSKQPTSGPYPEPHEPLPRPPIQFKNHFNIILLYKFRFSKWHSFLQIFPSKPCIPKYNQ